MRNKSSIEKHAEQLSSNQIEKYYKPVKEADENSVNSIAALGQGLPFLI